MAGYIGKSQGVTQVDGYNRSEADAEFVQVSGDTMTGAMTGTDLTLSGGVYLGGTGAANYLDDYEEGTWTPTYNPATTGFTSITYDGATLGKYTKIGQSVYILGVIRTDSISGGAGRIDLGGLPFSALYGDVSICIGYTTAFAGDHPSGGYLAGSGLIRLTYKTAVSGPLNNFLDISDLGTGGNDNFILFTMTYITSA